MMGLPAGTRIWLAAGVTDMRAKMNGFTAKVQLTLSDDPLSGHVFVVRGRRSNVVKLVWATSGGVCLLIKRLERGGFMYGLIGTARLNGINPEAYLRYVFTHIADYPINRVSDLLPWNVADRLTPKFA